MYQDRRPKFSPVREGEELDVKIEAVGEKGDGIAKKNGFVLFIPGVNEGDEVRIKVTRVLKKVGFAEKLGDAQGPIESNEPKARTEKAYVPPPKAEPLPQDSEDFGEEVEDSEELDVEEPSDDVEEPSVEDSDDVEETSDDNSEDNEEPSDDVEEPSVEDSDELDDEEKQ